MGSLEDQLKKWKQDQAKSSPATASSSKPSSSSKSSKSSSSPTKPGSSAKPGSKPSSPGPAAQKKPTKNDPAPLQVMRRDEPAKAPPPRKKTDAELFAEAVANVDHDVVLDKFSQSSSTSTSKGRSREPAPPPPTDAELFAQFVGDTNVAAEQDGGQKARLVRIKKDR